MNPSHLARAATVAACLLASACGAKTAAYEETRPVRTLTVGAARAAAETSYAAEIRPRYESRQSFRVGGKIAARLVEVGQHVTAGQPLVRLDPQDLELELTGKRAQLAAAESDLKQQEADLKRYRELLAQNFISQAEFERRSSAATVAREKAKAARADLAASGNRTAYATLTAERAGVVSFVEAEPGQVVAAGQIVVRIALPGEKEAVIAVPEARLAEFRRAGAYRVALWADGDKSWPARLRELSPEADAVGRTFTARLSLLQPDDSVKLGMTATVYASAAAAAQPAGMSLPLGALLDSGGKHYVWVLDGKAMRVQRREVAVAQVGSEAVSVASGLKSGEEIVTAGVHLLRENMKVKRLDPAPGAGKPALALPEPAAAGAKS